MASIPLVPFVAQRLGCNGGKAQRAADRAKVEAALAAMTTGRSDLLREILPHRRRAGLMAETLIALLSAVRGRERQVMLDTCRLLGVDVALRARITHGPLADRLASVAALAAFPGAETEEALARALPRAAPRLRLALLGTILEIGGQVSVFSLIEDFREGRLDLSAPALGLARRVAAASPVAAAIALEDPGLEPAVRATLLEGLGDARDGG